MPSHTCVGAPHKLKIPEPEPIALSPPQEAARQLLEGPARYTCLAGGTRSGKTFLIVRAIVARAIHAPHSRHALLRFHANAAKASLAQDTLPHVMKLCFPHVALKEHRQDGVFALSNGARLTVGGLDDDERVEKILGLEYASVFLNEASQIPYESALIAFTRLAQVIPGLKQRAYIDLNPTSKTHWTNLLFGEKRDPVSMKPLAEPEAYARAFLNPRDNAANLSKEFLASLEALPERQRKRFFEGVYVDAVDDALWSYEVLDRTRVTPEAIPEAERKLVVVAIDPSGAKGRDDLVADEIGIIVAALGTNGDAYILSDRSCRDRAEVWAQRAVHAFHEYRADCIVAEVNFGGDMVGATIRAADPHVPVRLVTASRGKAVRAEPISLRYAKGQVHHAGRFDKLEAQLCAFTGGGYNGQGSPDHADAAIWALTHLFDQSGQAAIIDFYERATSASALSDQIESSGR
jgi:phage terminase large subunit-like protein